MQEATEDVASILGGSRLVDDVENILDGVSGINNIRTITGRILTKKCMNFCLFLTFKTTFNFLSLDPIADLFVNPKIIVDFLGTQLHFDENTTAQILDAKISIAEVN